MAAHTATIINAPGQSTDVAYIKWSSFSSGDNNIVFNVNNKDASKLLILISQPTTMAAAGAWIGTSDSRSSHTSMKYPYSAAKIGRMMCFTTVQTDTVGGFMSTVAADTEIYTIYAIGPLETARFKDSDGYINIARRKVAAIDSMPCYIAGILIP